MCKIVHVESGKNPNFICHARDGEAEFSVQVKTNGRQIPITRDDLPDNKGLRIRFEEARRESARA